MNRLSIIITVLNEQQEVNDTIKSIRETSSDVEIIVVDDFSDIPIHLTDKAAKLIRNPLRLGVGPSRHIGASMVSSSHFLILDAHMRFQEGWLGFIKEAIDQYPNTVFCCQCTGLSPENMDMSKSIGEYNGATICIYDSKTSELLEGKWLTESYSGQDLYEIPCLMGAAYVIPKNLFFKLRGLNGLKMWGSDEPYFSLKTWLAGYEIRMLKKVRVGHMFRYEAPYETDTCNLIYNKLYMLATLFPIELQKELLPKFAKDDNLRRAFKMLFDEHVAIAEKQEYYQEIFKHDIYWYCKKFGIALPSSPESILLN